jgi:hypothetical protein
MKTKKIWGLCLLFIVITSTNAQTSIEKVEATFIASFMRYINWPGQESMKTITVGVYAKNHKLTTELNQVINGKNVGLATINVIESESIADMQKCQMIFIPNVKTVRFKKEFTTAAGKPILTITEEQDYAPNYSIINFKVVNNRLSFQLNMNNAKQSKIGVSDRLIQMSIK